MKPLKKSPVVTKQPVKILALYARVYDYHVKEFTLVPVDRYEALKGSVAL